MASRTLRSNSSALGRTGVDACGCVSSGMDFAAAGEHLAANLVLFPAMRLLFVLVLLFAAAASADPRKNKRVFRGGGWVRTGSSGL
jgi:hypothetical protein